MPSITKRLADRGLIRPPDFLPADVMYETMIRSVAYGVSSDSTGSGILEYVLAGIDTRVGFPFQPRQFVELRWRESNPRHDGSKPPARTSTGPTASVICQILRAGIEPAEALYKATAFYQPKLPVLREEPQVSFVCIEDQQPRENMDMQIYDSIQPE